MLSAPTDRDPLDCLAEEFVQTHRQGQEPEIEDFVERYPAHATRIRDLFPALLVMEELRAAGNVTIADTAPGPDSSALVITKLGGYSILREIGRGGMGVVYEAVQHSLGRRIALKVLPLFAAIDPERRERFARGKSGGQSGPSKYRASLRRGRTRRTRVLQHEVCGRNHARRPLGNRSTRAKRRGYASADDRSRYCRDPSPRSVTSRPETVKYSA